MSGKKGKKNKGVTLNLNDFLSSSSLSWSDQVDEADKLGEFFRKPALPDAPRAARAIELDESRIPKNPPYIAYLTNLSYEVEENDIVNAFVDLNILNIRLPKDERSGRMKGFGYVEFTDRQSFLSALQKHEATIRGRRIKIDVAENEGERRRGGMRDNRDRDSNYDTGEWRSGPRSEFLNEDRRGPSSGRKDYGGFRDRDSYDRGRGDRDRDRDRDSSWRDSEKRYGSDRDNRSSYGNRRNYDDSESSHSETRARIKLNLKPRTLPIDEIVVKEEKQEEPKKSAASIFGGAKPVDTAAREREIEKRLEKEREGVKNEKNLEVSKTRGSIEDLSGEEKGFKPVPEPKENVWTRKSQKIEAQNTSQDLDTEKTDDLDESSPPPAIESERDRDFPNESEESRYDSKRDDDYENDRDSDYRYGRSGKNDDRYNDRNREGDRGFRRDNRWKDDKDRRDRRDFDRRDRDYESDRRGGNSGGRIRDEERGRDRDGDRRYNDREGDNRKFGNDKEGDSRKFGNDREGDSRKFGNDREGDSRKFGNDRENDWRKNIEKEGDNKRFQDRESFRHRDQDDHGSKGPRGDRRSMPPPGEKGSRPIKSTQEKERGPQSKDKPRDQKKSDDGVKMPKFKETAAPNYIGTNKYSFLEEDGVSE